LVPCTTARLTGGPLRGRPRAPTRGRRRLLAANGLLRREAKGRADGEAKALLIVLAGRGLEPTATERQRIRAERDLGRLERWLAAAGTCADLAELLALPRAIPTQVGTIRGSNMVSRNAAIDQPHSPRQREAPTRACPLRRAEPRRRGPPAGLARAARTGRGAHRSFMHSRPSGCGPGGHCEAE
jgi:hypothetical protein